MRRQLLAMAFVVAIAAVIQFGCGGGGPGATRPGFTQPTGSVALFGGDAPLCSILSFNVTITGVTLTPAGGGTPVSILASGNSITLDFASLMDFATMMTLSNVPLGTYDQLNVTLSNPQITFLDTSKTPPAITTISPTLSALSISLALNPPVTVAANGTIGLQLDFDLLSSVQTDLNGQITSNVIPSFTASQPTPTSGTGFADFDDLRGIVQSVSTNSSSPAFTGDFTVQTVHGPTLAIHTTSSTQFDGVSGLSGLTVGTLVEVHAFLDSSGNLVAKEVEAEEQEDAPNGKAAFVGLITSVVRDPSTGAATQFNMYVREEDPDVSSRVALRSSLTVNVTSSTRFVLTAKGTNFASFSFGATTLGVGQRVVVHGQLPSGTGAATGADARSIFLGLQPILGNLSLSPTTPIVKNAADSKLGGFTLLPCSPVFQSQPPITVLTSDQTAFAGLSDLNGLTAIPPLPLLLVKGLLFYQQTSGNVNSVTWIPPANVQVAKQVHQLP